MIEGHGDDSYKYRYPIRSNFSSNVYNKVNLDGLRAHLCGRISAISAYPEPEPYTLEARLADRHALPCRFGLRDEWCYGSHLSDSADLSGNEHGHSDAYV